QTRARFTTPGRMADRAGLKIGSDAAPTSAGAQAGEALNLGTGEIAAFNAVPGGAPPAIQGQLQKMLLTRYQAYRTSGLPGIVPYDRGSGRKCGLRRGPPQGDPGRQGTREIPAGASRRAPRLSEGDRAGHAARFSLAELQHSG